MGKREEGVDDMPEKLVELLERSESLYCRIARLDDVLFGGNEANPGVKTHFERLEAAFGGRNEWHCSLARSA